LRGSDERTGSLFSYVDLEARVREDQSHPIAEAAHRMTARHSGKFPTADTENDNTRSKSASL
jgi:hypothetical protein